MKDKINLNKKDRSNRSWDNFDLPARKPIKQPIKKQINNYTMLQIKSLQGKLTPNFIDYCNTQNIDLVKWYRWQLHLIWEQRNIYRRSNKK